MPSTSHQNLEDTFSSHFVTLRTALGMTQAVLAEQLSVTERAIQRWEGGTRTPKAESLKAFLALCLQQQALPVGREIEEARILWKSAHLKVLFDEAWVRSMLNDQNGQTSHTLTLESDVTRMPHSIAQRLDLGEEVSAVSFYGREREQEQLTAWILQDHCRLITLSGMGGIGKSSLAVTLLHHLSPSFHVAVFRSVRDAMPCEELVAALIQTLAPEPPGPLPALLSQRITLLLDLLQTRRCLVVLDNVESLLQDGEQSGQYRVGYEDYAYLFERLGTTQHQSCLLLTSREKLAELMHLEGSRNPVRSLHLMGLDEEAGEQILQEKQLRGETDARQRLIHAYSGNPLALKIVAQTIHDLFAGEIAPFLEEGQIIFRGVRALLAQQFARLPFLAQSVLFWLAILREPVDVSSLLERFVTPVPRLQVLEALEDLRRRSLVEHGQQRFQFTLQSVVMEFVTEELVQQIAGEVQRKEPDALLTYALSLASAKEYIRQTQERLLLAPVLFHLGASQHRKGVVEQQLLRYLGLLRSYKLEEQGYGPTNIAMLLLRLKGHLQGVNLSGCTLREASLQGVQMQDALLHKAFIRTSTFTEIFSTVTTTDVSNNGMYWAAGSNNGDVRIFSGESSIPSLVLHAHNSVAIITFSPDGTRLATGGRDSLIKIWDIEHGTLHVTLQGRLGLIQGMAFSPDGTRLATSSMDGTVCIWSLASSQVLHLLHSHEQGVSKVTWSPDGRLLASAGDNSIRLWNPLSGQGKQILIDNENTIYGIDFSPDSRFLVSGGTDHLVKVWDIASGKCLERLRGHMDNVIDTKWSPDGQLFASASYDTTIRIWNTHPFVTYQVLRGHTDHVQSIAFSVDGQRLLSGSADRSVRLWDIAQGDCVRLMQGYTLNCYSIAWNPREDIIASATSDGLITLWNATQEKPIRVLRGHTQVVFAVAWSPDGQLLASGSGDQTIRIWNASTGECLAVLHNHIDLVYSLAWSPDGQLLACGGYHDRNLHVWNLEKKQDYWTSKELSYGIYSLAWSPDGSYLAGGYGTVVHLWNAKDGTTHSIFNGHREKVIDVTWSPDGTRIVSCDGVGVIVWDTASGIPLHTLSDPAHIRAVAWSPEGKRILAGGRDGTLYRWDTESWTCLAVHKEHQNSIRSISISSDGRTAASADDNGIIIIWDMEQAIPLHILRPDRPYERLDISSIQGITEAQKMTLRALGAIGD